MLEKSVLQVDEIPDLLLSRYDFSDVSVHAPLEGGTANLWTVRCDGRLNVLKEFQSRLSVSDVQTEPEINLVLKQRGLPVVSFVETLSGDYVWSYRDRAFHLQTYAEGHALQSNQAPPWLMGQAARLLSDIHEAMPDLVLPSWKPSKWYDFDRSQLDADYSKLLEDAERLDDEEARDAIRTDLEFRLRLTPDLDQFELRPEMFTCRATHGDYHIGQFLVSDAELVAVVDFSAACQGPVVWEIIRSFTCADPACADGSIPVQSLVTYVGQYLEKSALQRSDIDPKGLQGNN
jgi:Ser/Thr protein kinase RdoA (MazF antagonist)